MEDVNNENKSSKKRTRDDSDLNSSEFERVSPEDSELNSPEAKRIRDDLLDILDDSDTATQDLDSVIRSFEEEILHQPSLQELPAADSYPSSDSGESQPELGYLLEASDDELGLPPTISPSEEQTNKVPIDMRPVAPAEALGFGEMMGFEDKIPSYDSFEYGIVQETQGNGDINSEYVTLGGWFDYSEASDFSEFSWPLESLPGL